MANASISGKSKSRGQHGSQATEPGEKEKKRELGGKLMATRVTQFAAGSPGMVCETPANSINFVEPLSMLIQSVPEKERLSLAEKLLADLRKAFKATGLTDYDGNFFTAGAKVQRPGSRTRVNKVNATPNAAFLSQLEAQESAQREKDIEEGRLITGTELCSRLKISSQALSAKLKRKKVFAIKSGGRYYYPAFFGDSRYDPKVLETITEMLGDLPGASKWYFFTTKRISLKGKSPLGLLTKGRLEEVFKAVQAFLAE